MTAQTAANLTKKRKKISKNTPDAILIAIILIIVGFGIIMVYSASFYYATVRGNAPSAFAMKQLVIGLVGIVVMLWVTFKFNYRIFSNMILASSIYIISLILSVSVMFIGQTVNGATRWIDLGFTRFQPSEIAKIGVVIMLSAYIIKHRKEMNKFKYIARAWGIVLLPTGIVAIENLSSAIVVFFIGIMIIFITSSKIWYYVVFALIGVGLAVGVYSLAMTTEPGQELTTPIVKDILKSYRLDRIRVWKDPWLDPKDKGYQPIQSLYAVGSGGIFGVGLGKGIQKQGFLPEPHNDIIFAVICEELGLIGAVTLLLGYTILVIRGLVIAVRASDYFGTLVAVGISTMVGIQVLINVAVNTNTIPTTGMQLPLVSYGGTALAVLLGTLGLLLNISTTSNIQKVNK
ncbi:FtsW/RodA/SpoVE family cell cycle protein [Cellulosilyticum sp. I15G10I2]|uniref:FtsW/RodA/SpoVE family cell cycle protein n=1 Tax=Cellulosilyticum sp. I15G10I2 TaxID=1892843 RepID=UPI0009F72A53|nr:FtsW/RodA/SpoVE family cell cycle protein [Cellulosilyticum sp. I15G10I2]